MEMRKVLGEKVMLFFTLPQGRLNLYNPRALVTTETTPINSKPFSKTIWRANMKENASLCKVWHLPPTLLHKNEQLAFSWFKFNALL